MINWDSNNDNKNNDNNSINESYTPNLARWDDNSNSQLLITHWFVMPNQPWWSREGKNCVSNSNNK